MSVSHIMTLLDCYLHIEDRHILELLGIVTCYSITNWVNVFGFGIGGFLTFHGNNSRMVLNLFYYCMQSQSKRPTLS